MKPAVMRWKKFEYFCGSGRGSRLPFDVQKLQEIGWSTQIRESQGHLRYSFIDAKNSKNTKASASFRLKPVHEIE